MFEGGRCQAEGHTVACAELTSSCTQPSTCSSVTVQAVLVVGFVCVWLLVGAVALLWCDVWCVCNLCMLPLPGLAFWCGTSLDTNVS